MRLAAPAAPVPVRTAPSAAWDAAVNRYLSAEPVAVLPRPARRLRDDMMFDLQVNNILCCLEDFNNGIPEDDNDNDGAARRLRRRGNCFLGFNTVSRILDHMNINSQCDWMKYAVWKNLRFSLLIYSLIKLFSFEKNVNAF